MSRSPAVDDQGDQAARRRELIANLADVRTRLERACVGAGRTPAEVTLIAVTKTFPVADVRLLAGLGVTDVGENRADEVVQKARESAALELRWHFVGQLQTNKAAAVARRVDVVHSVDRSRLIGRLSRALGADAEDSGVRRTLRCLVQIQLDDRPGRGGVLPQDAAALADEVAASPGLELGGVMAVAPLDAPAGPAFARLAEASNEIRRNHPKAEWISAGMTDDLEPAVKQGATHVRIGRAVLGARPSLR